MSEPSSEPQAEPRPETANVSEYLRCVSGCVDEFGTGGKNPDPTVLNTCVQGCAQASTQPT
jgi:hypothetical protein